MKTCTARLEREEDGRWTIELEEEPRVHTWGKTVDEALTRMREAAALWFDTDEDHIELVAPTALTKTGPPRDQHVRRRRHLGHLPPAGPPAPHR